MIPAFFRAHWFLAAAPLLVATDAIVVVLNRSSIDRVIEAGVLFDLVLLLPLLYWLCYRRRGRASLIGALAAGCSGIWCALKLIPESRQDLVLYLAPLRYFGLVALLAVEVAFVIAMYRSIFQGETAHHVSRTTGVPKWLARLLVLEAQMWLRLYKLVRQIFGRS